MKNLYVAILAGGSGERLWPLSSAKRPKQLIPFINGTSLLEQTVQRVQPLCKNKNFLFIVTNNEQQEAVKKVVGKQATVLTEPIGRNTGPALLLACLEIYEKNPDAVLISLPSDHFIPETEKLVSILWAASAFASCYDKLVLVGVKPTTPATGYGYISYDPKNVMSGFVCFPVIKFHEKPDKEQAESYLKESNMLWNIGIFVGRVSVFLQEIERLAPDLWHAMQDVRKNGGDYSALPAISFDYAVMEKSEHLVVFPADFQWHDVGSLSTFLTLKLTHEKNGTEQVVNVDAQGNLACTTKKTVAFVGVSNVCVIETDDVIMVTTQDQTDSIRQVVAAIKEQDTAKSLDIGHAEKRLEKPKRQSRGDTSVAKSVGESTEELSNDITTDPVEHVEQTDTAL